MLFARSCGFINLYAFKYKNLSIYTIFCTDPQIFRPWFSRFLAFYNSGFRAFLFLVAGTAGVFSGNEKGTLGEKYGKCALCLWRVEHYSFERVTGIDIVIILHTVELPSKWCVWSCSLSYADADHFSFIYMCTGCNDSCQAFVYTLTFWRSPIWSCITIQCQVFQSRIVGIWIAVLLFESRHISLYGQ